MTVTAQPQLGGPDIESDLLVEYRRLGDSLRQIRSVVERRVEHVELLDHRYFDWRVVQQLKIPTLNQPADVGGAGTRLITLGIYGKSRLPDLEAFAAGQDQLAVLTGTARATATAAAVLAGHVETNANLGAFLDQAITPEEVGAWTPTDRRNLRKLAGIQADPAGPEPGEARDAKTNIKWLDFLARCIKRVVLLPREEAALLAITARRVIESAAPTSVKQDADWRSLIASMFNLVEAVHLLCVVDAAPGTRVTTTHRFTDRRSHEELGDPEPMIGDIDAEIAELIETTTEAGKRVQRLKALARRWGRQHLMPPLVRLLRFFSMMPVALVRRSPSATHAKSFYLLATPPEHMRTESLHWISQDVRRRQHVAEFPTYVSTKDGLSYRDDLVECQRHFGPRFFWHVQVRPHGGVGVAAAISAALVVLATWSHWNRVPALQSDNASLIAVVPGALLAVLTLTGSQFTTTMTRGLRLLGWAVALAAAVYTVGISIAVEEHGRVTRSGLLTAGEVALSTTATFATIVFAFVSFWPRPDRSRSIPHRRTAPAARAAGAFRGDETVRLSLELPRQRPYSRMAAFTLGASVAAAVTVGVTVLATNPT